MKFFRFFALMLTVMLSACGGAVAQEKNYPQGMQNCTVELNGDSIALGYITNGSTYRLPVTPAQYLRNYGYQVVDKAAGGLRTYDLVRGYVKPWPDAWPEVYPNGQQGPFWMMPHDSRIVIIATGINDHREPYNLQQTYMDYAWLVDYIRSQGKIPVIAGVSQLQSQPGWEDMITKVNAIRQTVKQVAIDKGVHYASWDTVPLIYTDGIHLQQASSNALAENLRYVLSVICGTAF